MLSRQTQPLAAPEQRRPSPRGQRWRNWVRALSAAIATVGLLALAACKPAPPAPPAPATPSAASTPAPPAAARPAGAPPLHEARVVLSEGTARFHDHAAVVLGADFTVGKAWWLDVDGDGEVEVLAEVSYSCDNEAACGNAWGGYLAAWRWRGDGAGAVGRYDLVATAPDVKGVAWLRQDDEGVCLRGTVKTGPSRNDVMELTVGLRLVGARLLVGDAATDTPRAATVVVDAYGCVHATADDLPDGDPVSPITRESEADCPAFAAGRIATKVASSPRRPPGCKRACSRVSDPASERDLGGGFDIRHALDLNGDGEADYLVTNTHDAGSLGAEYLIHVMAKGCATSSYNVFGQLRGVLPVRVGGLTPVVFALRCEGTPACENETIHAGNGHGSYAAVATRQCWSELPVPGEAPHAVWKAWRRRSGRDTGCEPWSRKLPIPGIASCP